jgi:hypothetical protein
MNRNGIVTLKLFGEEGFVVRAEEGVVEGPHAAIQRGSQMRRAAKAPNAQRYAAA